MPSVGEAVRFWAKVEKTEGCWLWKGAVNGRGYGSFYRQRDTYAPAHIVAYELEVGSPDGLDLHHTCRNRLCVRPSHLKPMERGEHLREHGLPDATIVQLYSEGKTTRQIAESLRCNAGAVSRVLKRNGMKARTSRHYKTLRLPDEQIKAWHLEGVRADEIARRLGVSAGTVLRRLQRLGLRPHRQGNPGKERSS